jgi:hypothetical protein
MPRFRVSISLRILPNVSANSIVGGISTITSGRTNRSIWQRQASAMLTSDSCPFAAA